MKDQWIVENAEAITPMVTERQAIEEQEDDCGCQSRKMAIVRALRAAADWLENDYSHEVGAAIGTLLLATATFLGGVALGLLT